MEALFWEVWYDATSGVRSFIEALPMIVGGLATTAAFIFGKERAELGKAVSVCVLVIGIIFFNYTSPEKNYRNALSFRYGNNGFPIDNDIALIAFRRAAEGNHKEACRYAGDMLEARGDTLGAVKMWVKAVKLGDAGAARQLGDFYARGNFQNLTEVERLNSAYLAYYEGVCLGDATLQNEVDRLRQQVSWQTHRDAMEKCAALRKHLGRRG